MPKSGIVIAFALIALSGCGGPNPAVGSVGPSEATVSPTIAPTDDVGSPASQPTPRPTPIPQATAQPLVVEDYGFTYFPGSTEFTQYAVVISNPNPDTFVAEFVDVNITFYDDDGTVVASESETITQALPGQTNAVGGAGFPEGEATSMEVAIDYDWEEIDFDVGEFILSNLKTTSDRYSTSTRGVITSTFEEKQEDVEVIVVWRDSAGRILGGDFTYVDFVNAGQKVSFEVTALDRIRGIDQTEAYANL